MNSIKLTYEEYRAFQAEDNAFHVGSKPITEKIKRFGVNPEAINFYVTDDIGTGVILSNAPLSDKPTIEPGVNKTEVMNIFNELLSEWYVYRECEIVNLSGTIEKDMWKLKEEKTEYIKQFKKALGVE